MSADASADALCRRRIHNYPDFNQTLKVGFWDQQLHEQQQEQQHQ